MGCGGFFTKAAGGYSGYGKKARLEWMYEQLVETYNDSSDPENQQIDIIGFSRGAALAREFANMIAERGIPINNTPNIPNNLIFRRGSSVRIRFLGVFDTVASFGQPGNKINIGVRLDLPANVDHVAHALSAHEVRSKFPLTRFAPGPNVTEMWFAGVHADVGGGHQNHGKNKKLEQGYVALWWMHQQAVAAGVPMKPFPAEYMDAINAYQQKIGPNAPLWSADREDMLVVAPQHDSTDPPQYWPDKAKKWLRSSLRRNPYVRKVY